MAHEEEIRRLLDTLNYWEQQYGVTYVGRPDLKSTGEANARIAELKEQLVTRGAVFHWNGRGYVLDEIVLPSQGRQGPDTLQNQ